METTLTKKHRACLNCSIILTKQQFQRDGCPNCPLLGMKGDAENVLDTTSEIFKGVIAVIKPETSWVAKWQRNNTHVPGLYAMIVEGILPDEFINRIESGGKVYYPRDKSFKL